MTEFDISLTFNRGRINLQIRDRKTGQRIVFKPSLEEAALLMTGRETTLPSLQPARIESGQRFSGEEYEWTPTEPIPRDYYVTICDACRKASCWQDESPCDQHMTAGTVDVLASLLRKEANEHPSFFSQARLHAVCGVVRYSAEG